MFILCAAVSLSVMISLLLAFSIVFFMIYTCFLFFPQREFEDIASQFQNHDNVRLILKYDESLSRSIYAASDIFIIPSIFEPCGLTQVRFHFDVALFFGSYPELISIAFSLPSTFLVFDSLGSG